MDTKFQLIAVYIAFLLALIWPISVIQKFGKVFLTQQGIWDGISLITRIAN